MKSAVNRSSIPALKLLDKILYIIKLAYFFNVFLSSENRVVNIERLIISQLSSKMKATKDIIDIKQCILQKYFRLGFDLWIQK